MQSIAQDASIHILRARGVHRWLGEGEGRVHVLRGVDLDLERGKTYAVVGPSGCGKSTLLYLIGLLDFPDEGSLEFEGHRVEQASDEARTALRNHGLGFVFQFHFLLAEFTAAENIMLPMRKQGHGVVEARTRAIELLQSVGLAEKADRLATHLSGGEQQRVAIARAMANRPRLLLCDEPTGNLDAQNSHQVFELLKQIAVAENQSVLVVTHNPELAALCDVTLKMRDGAFVS
jgi:lipoprotein-releasing system ATP-binding protein